MQSGSQHPTFSERIRKRHLLWYPATQLRSAQGCLDYLHRIKERVIRRDRNDPDETWRSCCEFWQRTLTYKLNSREFAQRYGCRVPDLYWSGMRLRNLPLNSLPECYVIKPNFASRRRGVYLMAAHKNLMTEKSYTDQELREDLKKTMVKVWNRPILVEEFVTNERGEYKWANRYSCHVFGDTIGAVEVTQWKVGKLKNTCSLYSTDWDLLTDQTSIKLQPAAYVPPPNCLEEMLVVAGKLGKAYDAYVRIDFFSSENGCVFGEFSSTPWWGEGYVDYLNEYFGALWQEHLGDKI